MCRFCETERKTIKKITVCKYEETRPVYDGIFGEVEVGQKTTKRQPCIKRELPNGYDIIPMPVEFSYCPHCGRKIKEDTK